MILFILFGTRTKFNITQNSHFYNLVLIANMTMWLRGCIILCMSWSSLSCHKTEASSLSSRVQNRNHPFKVPNVPPCNFFSRHFQAILKKIPLETAWRPQYCFCHKSFRTVASWSQKKSPGDVLGLGTGVGERDREQNKTPSVCQCFLCRSNTPGDFSFWWQRQQTYFKQWVILAFSNKQDISCLLHNV